MSVCLPIDQSRDPPEHRPISPAAALGYDGHPMPLNPGTRLGVFEILSTIGAGGMGEVYRARDTRLKRDVAIKILPAGFAADADRRARFEREAELLASLNHSHIASIYGVEESSGTPALVLELVEGETLADRLRRGAIPIGEATTVAVQIAQALEAAHDRGIIHRDLKPGNVKLTPDGTVKVLDFGIAKALNPPAGTDDAARALRLSNSPTMSVAGTLAGVLLGTAAYMSPEQARGQAVDARTDIWAFGCVLYEMITGRAAFTGGTGTDILAAVVRQDPDWSVLATDTPETLRRLLGRCLAKDPKRRLRHIADARLELEDTPAAPVAPTRARGRERLAWTLATASLLALAVMATGLFSQASPPASAPPAVTRFTRITSGPAHENAPAISPDGKWVAYLSNARGVTDVWVKFVAGGDPANLTASSSLDLQSQTDIGGLAISPDGASIAFDAGATAAGPPSFAAWVIPAPLGGVARKLVANGRAIRWSPDARKITYVVAGGSGGDALWVADADGANPREIAPRRGGIHKHWPAWSRDGRYIYFNNSISTSNVEPAEIYRVPTAGGRIEPVVMTSRRAVFPAFTPDAKGLIYAANPDTADLSLWWKPLDRAEAKAERLTTGVGEYAEPSVSADGRLVVSTLIDVRESLVTLPLAMPSDKLNPIPITTGYTGDLDPTLSADGERLVFSSTRSGNRNLWSSRLDGTAARPLTSGAAIDERPAFSPDGQRIAFISDRSGRRAIWLINADGGAARLVTEADVLDTISWSPNGSRIVFAVPGDEPSLRAVTVADGAVQPIATPGPASAPAWSPRDDVIAYQENVPTGPTRPISLHIAFVKANGDPAYQAIPAPNLGNGGIAWDPKGERIAVIGNSGVVVKSIWIFDPRGGQPARKVFDFPADVRLRGVSWARDGQSLIVGQHRGTGDIVLFELAKR
jgi:serine/threonine protein kinase/Tol biopolymer transport system component